MTYVPHVPLWCWVLSLTEDAFYFSQPTEAWVSGIRVRPGADGACVARCGEHSRLGTHEEPIYWTPEIQCGQVAGFSRDETFVCTGHYGGCDVCGRPMDQDGVCEQCAGEAA